MAHVPVQKIPCDIATANAALGAHKKGERVRELIEQRGCELLFLPPYSPDLNPIEEAFSKVKGFLGRAGARRTRKALTEAMGRALDVVTAEETPKGVLRALRLLVFGPTSMTTALKSDRKTAACELEAIRDRLVFVDEMGPNTALTPLYAWSRREGSGRR